MDRETHAVYEAEAQRWMAERGARHLEDAEALGRRGAGPSIDLGCGPGWHVDALARPAVALDGAKAMLDLVPAYAPDALRVQADLMALPFRSKSLGSGWAHHSYVHVPRAELPLALADLHRAMRPGAPVVLRVFGGEGEGAPFADDDFPGRFFALWPREALLDVFNGAGFRVDGVREEAGRRGDVTIGVDATRGRTLPDLVAPGLRLLLCGLNPSRRAADAGVGFVTASNRFWPAALAAGIVTRDRDPWHAVRHDRVGFTDLVKRATVGAAEIRAVEYRDGFARVERLAAWLEPAVVCFVGLAGWRAAVDAKATVGLQDRTVGGRPAYVMPNPSGLNAHTSPADLVAHLRAAAALA